MRVAVMGCVVNGPGEAREADLGVASGNGKGQIFVKGEVIKTVPESQIVETLIEEAMRIADQMARTGRRRRGSPAVLRRLAGGDGLMSDVELRPMTAEEYVDWYPRAISEYAEGHIKAGSMPADKAHELAAKQFAELLPDGLATPAHHLLIGEVDGERVGHPLAEHPGRGRRRSTPSSTTSRSRRTSVARATAAA